MTAGSGMATPGAPTLTERRIPFAKGAPENPLSDEELRQKVVLQIEPALGKAGCGEVLSCVSALEAVPDFSELTRLLAPSDRDA